MRDCVGEQHSVEELVLKEAYAEMRTAGFSLKQSARMSRRWRRCRTRCRTHVCSTRPPPAPPSPTTFATCEHGKGLAVSTRLRASPHGTLVLQGRSLTCHSVRVTASAQGAPGHVWLPVHRQVHRCAEQVSCLQHTAQRNEYKAHGGGLQLEAEEGLGQWRTWFTPVAPSLLSVPLPAGRA